jgi:molybdenum cofactor cytidylyltransferase
MTFPVTGILLAAGFGRRFDPDGHSNKLLAPLADGRPVAWHSAQAMLSALPETYAVVRDADDALADVLRSAGCIVIAVPAARDGMGYALAGGIAHSPPPASGWMVGLADMPWITPDTMQAMTASLACGTGTEPQATRIVVPRYQGERGHPVGFATAHGPALRALTGDEGARTLLQQHPLTWMEIDDPGVLRDVDTPADLGISTSTQG